MQQTRSFNFRRICLILLTLTVGFGVSSDLAHRQQQNLLNKMDLDSTGVSHLLTSRLQQSTDTSPLIALGYRLAAADQCDLAIAVFDRVHTLNPNYRDSALVAGWCHLKLVQASHEANLQDLHLATARKLIALGQQIDPLNSFGQALAASLSDLESNRP